ncbi:hypothetical protein Trydic_g16439 [Trypoxylus dichotomus]
MEGIHSENAAIAHDGKFELAFVDEGVSINQQVYQSFIKKCSLFIYAKAHFLNLLDPFDYSVEEYLQSNVSSKSYLNVNALQRVLKAT